MLRAWSELQYAWIELLVFKFHLKFSWWCSVINEMMFSRNLQLIIVRESWATWAMTSHYESLRILIESFWFFWMNGAWNLPKLRHIGKRNSETFQIYVSDSNRESLNQKLQLCHSWVKDSLLRVITEILSKKKFAKKHHSSSPSHVNDCELINQLPTRPAAKKTRHAIIDSEKHFPEAFIFIFRVAINSIYHFVCRVACRKGEHEWSADFLNNIIREALPSWWSSFHG